MAVPLALPLGERAVLDAVRREAHPLTGDHRDYDALMALIGDARIVLLGEASHGTHEFYRERARITKRLIAEHGFTAVAIEGDWPDAYRVNRYVRGAREDGDAEEALRGFRRFPTWMWRNADVLDLVGWLRAHNDGMHRSARRVGFYGLDLYSLAASMEAVVAYLDEQDADAAARARARYECLQPFVGESAAYGQAVLTGVSEPCRRRVIEQLVELRRSAGEYLRRDGLAAEDEQFFAEQNAAVVANAEEYYRTMFGDRAGSWNLRDRHMADTLDQLLAHLDRHGGTARVVVWAHNSHVGDARATEMGAARRAEHRPAHARAPRPRRRQRRLHHLRRHRHRCLRLGRAGRAQARPTRAARQLRSPPARHAHPRLPAVPARRRRQRTRAARTTPANERSASSTAPRPNARATTSPPAPPASSTRSSTSTTPEPSSRSNAPRRGSAASRPRPIPQRSERSRSYAPTSAGTSAIDGPRLEDGPRKREGSRHGPRGQPSAATRPGRDFTKRRDCDEPRSSRPMLTSRPLCPVDASVSRPRTSRLVSSAAGVSGSVGNARNSGRSSARRSG